MLFRSCLCQHLLVGALSQRLPGRRTYLVEELQLGRDPSPPMVRTTPRILLCVNDLRVLTCRGETPSRLVFQNPEGHQLPIRKTLRNIFEKNTRQTGL